MIIIVVSGYSGSSTGEDHELHDIVSNQTNFLQNRFLKSIDSSNPDSRNKIDETIRDHIQNHRELFLIGKSFGGYEIYKTYRKNWKDYLFIKTALMTIDGHSPAPTYYGPYRSFKNDQPWPGVNIYNIFQRKEYPRGADWTGTANPIEQIRITREGVNHFNIIQETQTAIMINRAAAALIIPP